MSDEPKHLTVEELAEALGHELHSCGYREGTFACRIRHIGISYTNLKREREGND